MVSVFNRNIDNKISLAVNQVNPVRPVGRKLGRRKHNPLEDALREEVRNKLVRPSHGQIINTSDKYLDEQIQTNHGYFEKVSEESSLSVREAEEIITALPDLRLTKQILISSILSPNDMISKELLYSCDTNVFGDSTQPLIDVIRDYFNDDYKIKDKLREMLEKALFMEGAYISVILPESSVDDAINSNLVVSTENARSLTEDMKKSRALLGDIGNKTFTALENLKIQVEDNYEVFKLPKLEDKLISDRIGRRLGGSKLFAGLESSGDNSLVDIYPDRKDSQMNILKMKSLRDLDKETTGHPLEIIVPIESFIPVYVPGDPSNHKGGFILLDSSGNPLRSRGNIDQHRDLNTSFKTSVSELASGLMTASSDSMMGVDTDKLSGEHIDHKYVSKVYGVLLEKELQEKLSGGGVYTSNLEVGIANDIMRIMFARACKRLSTKLVYVPKDLYTYLAFDYKENGVGRSLLERTKANSSMRMVQEMADALANVRNAVDHKDVTLQLDPDDPDPMKTISEMLHSIQRSTRVSSPIGLLNLNDIGNAFQKYGWNVRTQGNEAVPDMHVEYNQRTMNYPTPDKDYADRLREQGIMSLGVSPDSVSGVMNTEYATNVVSSNIFLAQDALEKQGVFSRNLTEKVQMYTRNSSILMKRLVKVIEANRDSIQIKNHEGEVISKEILAVLFVNNIVIELPAPDLARLDMQYKALQQFTQMVDEALPALISADLFTEDSIGEDANRVMDEVIYIVRSTLIRNYLIENNILPEAFKLLFEQSDTLKQMNLLTVHQNYLDSINPILRDFIARSMQRKGKNNRLYELLRERLDKDGDNDSNDDYGSDDGNNDDTGGDDFGMDDDFDMGGEDDDDGGEEGDLLDGLDDEEGDEEDF